MSIISGCSPPGLLTAWAVHRYKILTISAGALRVPLFSFILASIVGRGPRFFILALLLHCFGERAKVFIDKCFHAITIAVTLVLAIAIAGVVLRPK